MYWNRMPIGTLKNIRTIDYNQLLKFHKKWYVPNNVAIGVIGDTIKHKAKKRLEELGDLNIEIPNIEIYNSNSIKYYPIRWDKSKVQYLKYGLNNKKIYCIEYVIKNRLSTISEKDFYKNEVIDIIIDKLIELKTYKCLTDNNLNDSFVFISNTPFLIIIFIELESLIRR